MPLGKKECPSCKKSLGVRTLVCECGHTFGERKNPPAQKGPATFTEGGKGRKLCRCGVYVAAVVQVCPSCNAAFTKNVAEEKKPETFTEGGRGRKQCPACKVYCGGRNHTCPKCGNPFEKKEREEPEVPAPQNIPEATREPQAPLEKTFGGGRRSISTPAGDCPVKLTGDTQEDVEMWAHSLIAHARKQDVSYTVSAMKYWLRDTYDYGSPPYRRCCEYLDEIFPVANAG